MNKNITLIGMAAALVVGGAIGYFGAGYQYSAQLDKAKAAFPTQATMSYISGVIQSVSGSTITMKTPSLNPFENLPTVRTVTVTSSTKIVKIVPKDPKVFQQELDAYQKSLSKSTPKVGTSATSSIASTQGAPSPTNEVVLKISDLKAGDSITVDAGKDIKTQATFDAVRIIFSGNSTAQLPVSAIPSQPAVSTGPVPTGSAQILLPKNTSPAAAPAPTTIKASAPAPVLPAR